MSKPNECRANAQECERIAEISRKAVWHQMAQQLGK